MCYYVGGLLIKSALFSENIERGFKYRQKFTNVAIKILGVQLKRSGSEPEGAALYVSNHRSLLDPFLEVSMIRAYIVSKSEVDNYPLIGAAARTTGVIFVDRAKHDSRAAAKEAIRQKLLDGYSVLIYPEGTTSNVPTTQDFKLGAFKVAAEEGIPVVPVVIEYKEHDHKWSEVALMPFFLNKLASKQIHTAISIGKPITSSKGIELLEQSREWINTELNRINDNW